jgi:hypothetical protein
MMAKAALPWLCALALVGCAKAPTELLVTVLADATVILPVTSLSIEVTDATGNHLKGGTFISLAAPPPDAFVAAFAFPATLQVALPSNAPIGEVFIVVEGSDPTTTPYVLARGIGAGTVAPETTMQGTVTLTAVPLPVPDGGVPDASDDAELDAAAPL